MKTYTICKNRSGSFKSILHHSRLISNDKFRKIRVDVEVLDKSVYPTFEDIDLLGDWSKLPGVSAFIWPSNKTFATLGFRTNAEGNLEVCPYANLNDSVGRVFPHEAPKDKVLTFSPGDRFYYEVEYHVSDDLIPYLVVSVFEGENRVLTSHSFQMKSMGRNFRTTSLWFGGADNDGNRLGGKAPSNVKFKLKHQIYKM